jgi:hypothetical protein
MSRPFASSLLLAAFVGSTVLTGCDSGGGMTTAPKGHDGKSATGQPGGAPAGGPKAPDAKAVPRKGGPAPR